MSDTRLQTLTRAVQAGDPTAERALVAELARAQDPELLAAAALRGELRAAVFAALDHTPDPSCVDVSLLAEALAEALANEATPSCGFAFRTLGGGSWFGSSAGAAGVLVADLKQAGQVVIGLGLRRAKRRLNAGSLWNAFEPWSGNAKPATIAKKVEAWADDPDPAPNEYGDVFGLRRFAVSRAEAEALARFERWAGPRGHALWQQLAPGPRRAEAAGNAPTKKDRKRLAELTAALPPSELEALLLERFARPALEDLSRAEAKALVALLETWAGELESLRPEDRTRLQGYLDRAGLSPQELEALLVELGHAPDLDLFPSVELEALLSALRRREGGAAPVEVLELGPWADAEVDDAALERLLARRDEPQARRALGAQWSARVVPFARWADLRPIRSAPRVRWKVRVPGQDDVLRLRYASPLGVLACTAGASFLLCADTGALRAELPPFADLDAAAEVLITKLRNHRGAAYDAWTGAELYRFDADLGAGHLVGGLYVEQERHVAYDFREPRRPPQVLWEQDGEGLVVTLDERGRPDGVCASVGLADRRGAVGLDPESLHYVERGATPVWSCPSDYQGGELIGLTPDLIYAETFRRGRRCLDRLDRRTGELLPGSNNHVRGLHPSSSWFVRDVILTLPASGREVAGHGLDEPLWSVKVGQDARSLQPGWGRVYVASGKRAVTCLEEGDDACPSVGSARPSP